MESKDEMKKELETQMKDTHPEHFEGEKSEETNESNEKTFLWYFKGDCNYKGLGI